MEVPLCNLLTSICDFVPCDWVMQKAYNTNLFYLSKTLLQRSITRKMLSGVVALILTNENLNAAQKNVQKSSIFLKPS